MGSGFIAGTPVLTPLGAAPIETLRAGDLVLTRSAGGGERCARPVIRTCERHDLEVLYLGYRSADGPGAAEALTVAFRHLFRVVPQGWTAAIRLPPDSGAVGHLVLADGNPAVLEGIAPIYTTDQPGVVWIAFAGGREAPGTLWNYLEGRLVAQDVRYDVDAWDRGRPGQQEGQDILFKATVYDIEVEEGHSYFAGKLGVWVADASPAGDDPAVRELRQRAEAGDIGAIHGYGLRIVQSASGPELGRAGYDLLVRAADRGHVESQYLVGAMSKDPAKAGRYRRMAAEQGHVRAQFDMGLACESGRDGERDVPAAMSWYGRAMAQGSMAAHYNLGQLSTFGGDGVEDPDTPAEWYEAGAQQSDAVAQWVLGLCHAGGRAGAAQDEAEAARYFQQAAAQGFGPAICSLAACYEQGLGVSQELGHALLLFHQAAKLNVAEAMYRLGCMYRDARGAPQDRTQAMAWFRKAAAAGWPQARAALRKMPEGDYSKARALLAMAERADEDARPPPQLLWEFANRVQEPDDADSLPFAFALFLHAAQQNHTEAQLQVALRYLRGMGVGQDSAEAARWYQRAAGHGSMHAQYALGVLHETGDGVPQDAQQARQLFELAAQQGHREAQFKLGLRDTPSPTLADLGIEPAPEPQDKRRWWKKW